MTHPVLKNTPIGTIAPTGPVHIPPTVDARTAGLMVLRDYISELTFYKTGNSPTSAIPFKIDAKDIHIEQPDFEQDLTLPSIVFESAGEAQIDDMGFYDETSIDLFEKNTVLWVHAEHIEFVNIHIYTAFRAERRAILAGLKLALSPVEEIYGMTLIAPNYYNQTISVCPISSTLVDGAQAANNRREAMLKIDLRVNIVQLVNYRIVVALARVNHDPTQP